MPGERMEEQFLSNRCGNYSRDLEANPSKRRRELYFGFGKKSFKAYFLLQTGISGIAIVQEGHALFAA